jgi:hypothetical protein
LPRKSAAAGAVKAVSGLRGCTYSERLNELGLPSLEDRRKEAVMMQVFKILNDECSDYVEKWFIKMENGRETRHMAGNTLRPQRASHNFRCSFFSCRAPDLWNRLPRTVREAGNAGQFKLQYRNHLNNGRLRQTTAVIKRFADTSHTREISSLKWKMAERRGTWPARRCGRSEPVTTSGAAFLAAEHQTSGIGCLGRYARPAMPASSNAGTEIT